MIIRVQGSVVRYCYQTFRVSALALCYGAFFLEKRQKGTRGNCMMWSFTICVTHGILFDYADHDKCDERGMCMHAAHEKPLQGKSERKTPLEIYICLCGKIILKWTFKNRIGRCELD
jgi:hypothetical protein